MSLTATASGAPETKKFRLSLPTQVVVERPIFTSSQSASLSETSNGTQSPGGPSPLLSSTTTIKEENEDVDFCSDDLKPLLTNGQSLVDVLSTAMMFQANVLLKDFFVEGEVVVAPQTPQTLAHCFCFGDFRNSLTLAREL
ncbi:unnamed protein product [Toxocara canis]|uniref:Uncharacterized protein n=1 Tax=Toxocara canis TaxID=6265 RepID=A0A183UPX1_TOXCA|nr:unnamed protein product [Toxocara canis]